MLPASRVEVDVSNCFLDGEAAVPEDATVGVNDLHKLYKNKQIQKELTFI